MADSALTVLHSAYAAVRGSEKSRALSTVTLDHLLQEQIDLIKGGETNVLLGASGSMIGSRLSKLDRLDNIEKQVNDVVAAVEAAGNDPAKLEAIGLSSQVVTP